MFSEKRTIPEIAALGPLHIEVTNRDHVADARAKFVRPTSDVRLDSLPYLVDAPAHTRLMLRSLDDRMLANIGLKPPRKIPALGLLVGLPAAALHIALHRVAIGA